MSNIENCNVKGSFIQADQDDFKALINCTFYKDYFRIIKTTWSPWTQKFIFS